MFYDRGRRTNGGVWEREGKEGLKKKEESDETMRKIRYKGNTVPITPVWKLSYKNHIQGQEEQSIMLVLIAIYIESAIRIITIQLLRNSRLLTRGRLTQET